MYVYNRCARVAPYESVLSQGVREGVHQGGWESNATATPSVDQAVSVSQSGFYLRNKVCLLGTYSS